VAKVQGGNKRLARTEVLNFVVGGWGNFEHDARLIYLFGRIHNACACFRIVVISVFGRTSCAGFHPDLVALLSELTHSIWRKSNAVFLKRRLLWQADKQALVSLLHCQHRLLWIERL